MFKTVKLMLCQVSRYSTENVITRFHFSIPTTRKQLLKIPTEHFKATQNIGSL